MMAHETRTTIPVEELFAEWDKDPEHRKSYEALLREMAVADKVMDVRDDSGFEQEELAERLDVAPSVIIRWEGGWQAPSLKMLGRLAEVTGHRFAPEFLPN